MKLYTKTVCPKCMWIKSEIKLAGLETEIVNIDHNEEARDRLLQAGMKSVPVLEVGGRFIADPEQMRREWERATV